MQVAGLAERFLKGIATEQEVALLHEWYDTADQEEIELVFTPQPETTEAVGKRVFDGLQQTIQEQHRETRHRRIVLTTRWVAAASVIVILVFTGKYFLNTRHTTTPQPSIAQTTPVRTDLPPGGNKATLQLSDGSVIDLAEANNGTLRHEAGALINKKDGELIYKASSGDKASIGDKTSASTSLAATNEASEMNTIRTPRGGQYQVILSDGTKVWLNSASSLSYPTTFKGKDRQVQVKGEAYFEVAEDKNRPFKLYTGDVQVDVLGTHFNVMAYEDENAIRTTLLAGAVRVTAQKSTSRVLTVGQQASMDRTSGVLSVSEVDAEESIAWKDGFFQFEGIPIETVMRQLARWYDVNVEYQGRTDEHFRGRIARSSNVSEVFKMLELTGAVHFSMEGKNIIVKP